MDSTIGLDANFGALFCEEAVEYKTLVANRKTILLKYRSYFSLQIISFWILCPPGYYARLDIIFAWTVCLSGCYTCLDIIFVWIVCLSGYYICLDTIFVRIICLSGYYICQDIGQEGA